MYIVKHKESGKYFKRGNIRSWWDAKLVEREKATVYRNKAGAKMSVGKMVDNEKPNKNGYVGVHYELDESVWEIEEIKI